MSEDRHNESIKTIDIEEYVKTVKHLTKEQQIALANVLEAYPDMYEGAIGTLNTLTKQIILMLHLNFPTGEGCE